MRRFLWNIITLRIITLISMAAYGLGYIFEFFSSKSTPYNIPKEYIIYNIRYLLRTIRRVLIMFIKEVLINKKGFFKRYLKERLTLYDIRELNNKYASKTIIWVHAHALGDMNLTINLLKILKKNSPDIVFIVSTCELAAYSMTQDAVEEINELLFLPFDIPFLINRVFKRLRPKLFIAMEITLWPNLFVELEKLGIRTMLLNGCDHNFYKMVEGYMIPKGLLMYFFNKVDFLGIRSPKDADRLIGMGADKRRIWITGRLRLDLEVDFPTENEKNKLSENLCLGRDTDIIVAGEAWGDEEIFLEAFREVIKRHPNLVLIIAPRAMKRVSEICDLVLKTGLVPKRRTQLSIKKAERGEVIILDTLGELYRIYGIARLSIIGGSFIEMDGPGGGNISEPLRRGSPIIIGPHTALWYNLIEEMKLKRVYDYMGLKEAIEYFLDNPDKAIASRDFALNVMDKYRGSFKKCSDFIERIILSKRP